jgi:tRNA-specific adenosine deaminase 3
VFYHYTFCTRGGDFLLALGLGSLFNHRNPPNVEYRVDSANDIVRYYACGPIHAGEELFIFYGHKLWFQDNMTKTAGSDVDGAGAGDESSPLDIGLNGSDDDL